MDRRAGLGWLQSWPAIALLLMTLLGIYQRTAPLENRRPATDRDPSKATPLSIAKNVELRLWQDPLDGVPTPLPKGESPHSLAELADEQFAEIATKLEHELDPPSSAVTDVKPARSNDNHEPPCAYEANTQIVFIPVDDERITEVREVRLRRRHAIIAALRSSGMVAESSRMNYLPIQPWYPPSTHSPISTSKSPPPPPNPIAFEWYKTDSVLAVPNPGIGTHRVLIVWIPSRAFDDKLLDGLDCFIKQLCCKSVSLGSNFQDKLQKHHLHLTLLGPESSSNLDGILRWTESNYIRNNVSRSPDSFLKWLHIVSPAATYDTKLTLKELRESVDINTVSELRDPHDLISIYENEESLLNVAGVSFQRTIGRDSALANQLISELERRGVRLIPKSEACENSGSPSATTDRVTLDNIALVSESNTLYGRSFPVTFADAMLRRANVPGNPKNRQKNPNAQKNSDVPNLHNYSYIRQIDGSRSADSTSRKPSDNINSNLNVAGTSAYPEAPFGDGQLDSIRRLALQLADEYRNGTISGKRLKAIGVIGTDVYDKLLILQALRQVFPNVIFFTTDLDARLYQTENLPWTRNLLVASHFGLSAPKSYQQGLLNADNPTFRDSYQTSFFFALRYQLGLPLASSRLNDGIYWGPEELESLSRQSHVFEIGREQAIDLLGGPIDATECLKLPSQRYPSGNVIYMLFVYGVALACLAALCLYTLVDSDQIVLVSRNPHDDRWRITALTWWLSFMALVVGSFIALIIYDSNSPTGEHWSLNSGTSVWPCLALRLAALLLAGVFTWKILSQHRHRNLKSFLASELQFRTTEADDASAHRKQHGPPLKILLAAYILLPLVRLRGLFSLGHHSKTHPKHIAIKNAADKEVFVDRCWRFYQRDTHPLLIAIRAGIMAGFMGIAFYAIATFADEPYPSYRGDLNRRADYWITNLSDAAVAFLAFIVVDSTLNVCQLVKRITHGKSIWPQSIQDQYHLPHVPQGAIVEVLDVRFVATITEQIGRQVYYPFFALMFIVITRLGLFDATSWTPPLMITYSLIFLSVPACIFILRRAAARGRDDSIRALQAEIAQARFKQNPTEPLEDLLKEIQETKRGAFSPLLDDPFFGALLLPSGGFTAVGLIERWLS